MGKTAIEWATDTWNPVRGCAPVSEGCRNCYAMRQAHRFSGPGMPYEGLTRATSDGPKWTGKVRLVPELIEAPLRWRKPRRVFVNSMSDLFHPEVPDGFITHVWSVMRQAKQHTFLILTKRPERMAAWAAQWCHAGGFGVLRNVWLGVSCEDQATADERIPHLLATPAAVKFVSAEPLLGQIDLTKVEEYARLSWVIAGGESGPGSRPCHPEWVRSLRDQCQAAGVAFFYKQWGDWVPFATTAGYRAGSFMPGNDEIIGGDCGGPCCARDRRNDGTWEIEFRDDTKQRAHREERDDHRWGKEGNIIMTYFKVGKKRAGRLLDGRTWDESPRWRGGEG